MVEGVDRQVCRGVYFLIYSYHMPAFFFVSGWLWREMGFADFIIAPAMNYCESAA